MIVRKMLPTLTFDIETVPDIAGIRRLRNYDDGLSDGEEYFGFFYESTNLWCYYSVQLEYICDSQIGDNANSTYLSLSTSDLGTDPTNHDSDGDGMPDGWEIENRRWVGSSFTGGNNWSLDPNRAEDANWDADGDGLQNLCEYRWTQVKQQAVAGLLLESHGENSTDAELWSDSDPNNIDSDGDSLPDGWEAAYSCSWDSSRVGINPLNGSDALKNPDGDGFDIDRDGIIQQNEAFVNYLEYHLRYNLFDQDNPTDFNNLPLNFHDGGHDTQEPKRTSLATSSKNEGKTIIVVDCTI